jgi:hypothetical protein
MSAMKRAAGVNLVPGRWTKTTLNITEAIIDDYLVETQKLIHDEDSLRQKALAFRTELRDFILSEQCDPRADTKALFDAMNELSV